MASDFTWSADSLGEVLSELIGRSGLSPTRLKNPPPSIENAEPGLVGQWIESSCETAEVEAQLASVSYPEIEALLQRAAPALIRVGEGGRVNYVALLRSKGNSVVLLSLSKEPVAVPIEVVRRWVCRRLEEPLEGEVDDLLERSGVDARRREKGRRSILADRLANAHLAGVWLLRPPPGASVPNLVRRSRLLSRMVALTGTHALQYCLWIASWWVIGIAALQGRTDPGMLQLWVVMVLSLVPLRMGTTWLQGSVAILAGALLKQRLLHGALKLDPEEIRHQGTGQLLARVLESEAMESLALNGGFHLLLGAIEVAFAAVVLGLGAGGPLHALLLVGWSVVVYWVGRRYAARRRGWTEGRLSLTYALVESLLGHRTRQAQESRARWHEDEDREVEAYSRASRGLDRLAASLGSALPRGWMIVGVLGLAPLLVGDRASSESLAVAFGGILLAYGALRRVTLGLSQLSGASIAWDQVAEMFDAAARPSLRSDPDLALTRGQSRGRVLLEAKELGFQYASRTQPVIDDLDLEVAAGDRILLEGPSGSGKSTLASLLAGLRSPSTGLLLFRGLDRTSAGTAFWRKSVILAPQFHENHILSESLAFNILMGHRWPPMKEDLDRAEELCRELGLGDLLERMPSGLFQMVGENGWQLSHGERSRVFIARTLIQEHDISILDESLGGLDGESAMLAAKVIIARSPTLAVVGHS